MKRLFALKFAGRILPGPDGKPLYFNNKPDAKEVRNELIRNGCEARVTRGPDHRRAHGQA